MVVDDRSTARMIRALGDLARRGAARKVPQKGSRWRRSWYAGDVHPPDSVFRIL